MDFHAFWTQLPTPDRRKFAERVGASPVYLNHCAFDPKRRIGESLAIAIDRESGGAVTVEEMRPDVDWAYIRNSEPTQ